MSLLRDIIRMTRMEDYYYPARKKGSSHKEYKNKNANIEYYTDEKGNIRRRKKQWNTLERKTERFMK